MLELEAILRGDPGVCERPEARGHPVDRKRALDHALYAPAGALTRSRASSPIATRAPPGHGDDGGRVEVLYVELSGGHRRLHR